MTPRSPTRRLNQVATPRRDLFITLRVLLLVGLAAAFLTAFSGFGQPATLGLYAAVGVNSLVLLVLLFSMKAGGVMLPAQEHQTIGDGHIDGHATVGPFGADAPARHQAAPEPTREPAPEPLPEAPGPAVVGFSSSAHPDPRLTRIGLSEDQAARLAAHRIEDPARLVATTPADVAEVLGVPVAQATGWQTRARLMQVRGVGPRAAAALTEAGLTTVEELADATPERLLTAVEAAHGGPLHADGRPVGVGTVAQWIAAAGEAVAEEAAWAQE